VRTKRERRVYYAYDDADEINAVSLSLFGSIRYYKLRIALATACFIPSLSLSRMLLRAEDIYARAYFCVKVSL